jgi:hypothetical protein
VVSQIAAVARGRHILLEWLQVGRISPGHRQFGVKVVNGNLVLATGRWRTFGSV